MTGVKFTFSPMSTVSFLFEVSTTVCCPGEISEKDALFLAFVGAAELLMVVVVVFTATAPACADFADERFRFELGTLSDTNGEDEGGGATSVLSPTAFTVLLRMALDDASLHDRIPERLVSSIFLVLFFFVATVVSDVVTAAAVAEVEDAASEPEGLETVLRFPTVLLDDPPSSEQLSQPNCSSDTNSKADGSRRRVDSMQLKIN